MRKIVSLVMMLVLSTTLAFAQSRTVTGTVTDESGQPVAFASVKIKNGKGGVAADANGVFKIEVKDGTVLIISAAGSQNKEVTITGGQTTITINLVKGNTELSNVVVSALGVKRSIKSTPYSVQQLDPGRLTQTRETDITTALAGKIAGLQTVGQSGSKIGSTGQVRLRGVAGFNDKAAIYVVDGTIFENSADINMDDVASVSVLKGPNATALYGQRAEGGVIVITTKKAGKNKPLNVQFNTTTTLEKVGILPEYQNLYGAGSGSNAWKEQPYKWKTTDPIEWKALDGFNRPVYSDDASWGPAFDGSDYIPWYAWYGGHSRSYKTAKWEAQPDNIRDFYQTGVTANNNINIAKGGEKYQARFGYTNLSKKGVLPNSKQDKNYFSTQLSYDFTKHFTAAANVGVTFENFKGDVSDTYGNSTSGSFNQWFHRDLDMNILKELRALKSKSGTFASWNIDDSQGFNEASLTQPAFWYNPYTWLDNLDDKTKRYRLAGDLSLTYRLNNDFRVTGTYRLNYRTTKREVKIPFILEQSAGSYGITADETGGILYSKYRHDNTKYREANYELIAQYNKKIADFSFEFLGGGNVLDVKRNDSSRSTNGGLTTQDVYSISNSVDAPVLGATNNKRQIRSVFFRGTVGYKDFLFVDFSARNDWSSTLPLSNNSNFYPSVGASFVFSDFVKNTALSYGKLRASVAQIGNDPLAPYATNFNFVTGTIPFGTDSLVGVPNTQIDPNLKAPRNTSYEAGVDARFFKDRVGFGLTFYREERKNEIVSTSVSSASGYTTSTLNAGKILRKGIELEMNIRPVVTRNFNWNIGFNWSTNKSTVIAVSENTKLTSIGTIGGTKYNLFYAIEGREWGIIRGEGIQRINGQPVIDKDGFYIQNPTAELGSVLPNYNGGFFNSFNWKGVTLTASVDFQNGGKYFSQSNYYASWSGLLKESAALNDNGVNVREPLSNGGGVHVFGVLADGKPYDKYVDAYDYFHQTQSTNFYDLSIFDATYIKLREVSLGYEIPVKKFGNISNVFKSAYVSVVGRNLWMIYAKNKNYDPTEISDTYYEDGQTPGTRSLGINFKFGF